MEKNGSTPVKQRGEMGDKHWIYLGSEYDRWQLIKVKMRAANDLEMLTILLDSYIQLQMREWGMLQKSTVTDRPVDTSDNRKVQRNELDQRDCEASNSDDNNVRMKLESDNDMAENLTNTGCSTTLEESHDTNNLDQLDELLEMVDDDHDDDDDDELMASEDLFINNGLEDTEESGIKLVVRLNKDDESAQTSITKETPKRQRNTTKVQKNKKVSPDRGKTQGSIMPECPSVLVLPDDTVIEKGTSIHNDNDMKPASDKHGAETLQLECEDEYQDDTSDFPTDADNETSSKLSVKLSADLVLSHDIKKEIECLVPDIKNENQEISTKLQCDLCSYSTLHKPNLKRHMRACHSDDKNISHICDKCGSKFKSKYGYDIHVKTIHDKTFRFTCHHCGKGYNTLWNFNGHLASHDNALRMKCSFCDKKFLYKVSLLRHEDTHRVVKKLKPRKEKEKEIRDPTRYGCDICSRRFAWRSSLCYHKRRCRLSMKQIPSSESSV